MTPPPNPDDCPRCRKPRPPDAKNEVYCDPCHAKYNEWLDGKPSGEEYEPRHDGVYCDDDDSSVQVDPDSILYSD